ncbi:MAG: hypothetical protein OSB09_11470 [Planctomycetota bacterium]|nr:hypothetical protein [Planctomycetota bacterium]
MDAVRQWIHAGLDAIERARSGLRHAVDDLVEEGTINREQAEAVLDAWKRKTDSSFDSEPPSPTASSSSSAVPEQWLRIVQRVVPVSQEEHDLLRTRVEELEKQLRSR